MQKVLVPCRAVADSSGSLPLLFGVRSTYLLKLYENSLVPIFVAPGLPETMLDALYAEASGLLLTGGEDVNPHFFGQEAHSTTRSDNYGRDELELTLTKTFLADRKPILGICRGCQVLAVAAGGSLIQHIPDVVTSESHDSAEPMVANSSKHTVVLEKDSVLAKIVGKQEVTVNSYHHQAVDSPGEHMTVSGRSPLGIIESIEHRDRRFFCIGVQSHPENETGDLESVFGAFAKACWV